MIFVNSSQSDSIRFTFKTAPDDSSTITTTIKLRYDIGDQIKVDYNDISGMPYVATTTLTAPLATSKTTLPNVKVPLDKSARYAVGVGGTNPAVYVVKRPLNFGINPQFVKVAGKVSRRDGPGGVATQTTGPQAIKGTVTRLEWAPDGQNLYFSSVVSSTASTSYYVYRISHLQFIGDSASSDYSGLFTSDIDSANTFRRNVPQRCTPIGKFDSPVTCLALRPDNMSLLITVGSYTNAGASIYESVGNPATLNLDTAGTSNFVSKDGSGLPDFPVYTALYEKNDNKRVLIGTEQGVYSTLDITQGSPSWVKETGTGTPFPNVPVFQIRQQSLPNWLSRNSGVIYVATHGRGIWSTDKYFSPYAIGIEEQTNKPTFGTNMVLYPNPTSNQVNLWFNAKGDADYNVNVYDINGRIVMQEKEGKLMEGEHTIQLNTSQLNSGVYFISINGTNNFNATSKLIISK
jgi:hypothetical protein